MSTRPKVLKFQLNVGHNTIHSPHQLSAVGSVADVAGTITAWIPCDADTPFQYAKFYVALTGETLPDGEWGYLGTCVQHGGGFVTHVFISYN